MRAAVYQRYGSPEVVHIREIAKPTPNDDGVLIRIYATTVTATDSTFRRGELWIARLFTGLRRPKITVLGDVLSGEVEAVGKDVRRFKVGDLVFASTGDSFGAHAEYRCLPETGALVTKPTTMDFDEAAAVCDGALIALPFLRDTADIQRGQQVLINGASGAVGTFAVQLARYFGAEVTGVCSTANVELVKSLGAETVIDYTQDDFTKSDQRYDIIFNLVRSGSFSRAKGSLKPGGVYLEAAFSLGSLFQALWTAKIGSKRAKIAATGLRPPGEKAKDLVFLKELIEAGKLRSVIDRRYPLEQAAEAHRYVETGHKKGNVVLTVAQPEGR